jgi:hypothetical protein
MTENFTERFIGHRNVGLAAKPISELTLHHGECGFDVTALVIVLQELIASELEVVIHLLPRSATVAPVMRGEGNKRLRREFIRIFSERAATAPQCNTEPTWRRWRTGSGPRAIRERLRGNVPPSKIFKPGMIIFFAMYTNRTHQGTAWTISPFWNTI